MPESYNPTVDTSNSPRDTFFSAILPRWLIKMSRPSRMQWLGPLLGLLLTVPTLFTGYSTDDHLLRLQTIPHSVFVKRPVWDYFNWISSDSEVALYREQGTWAGWHDPNALRLHLFRPLASILHYILFRFFDASPWVMHAGLALLYAALIVLCVKFYRRFSTTPAAIGIAILLFTIDHKHSQSAGWISAYNTMLGTMFGLLAFLVHDHWRRKKSIGGLLLFTISFIMALLASEGGLALLGYLVPYALFIERGSLRKRAATLAPGMIIAIGYLLFYFTHEYGAKNWGGAYVSPLHEFWISLIAVINNVLIFSMSQIIAIPSLTIRVQYLPIPVGALCAAAILASLVYIFRHFLRSSNIVAFYGSAMILAILPFTIGIMRDQLLLWASIGAAGFLGELFTDRAAVVSKLQRLAARTLLVCNTALAIQLYIPPLFSAPIADNTARLLERTIPSGNTVFLNAAGFQYFVFAAAIRCEDGGVWPEHCYTLFGGEDSIIVKRTGERTLRITAPRGWFGGGLLQTMQQQKFPDNEGDVFDLQLMTATIEKVTTNHQPLTVSFAFKKNLSEFSWMTWTNEGPKPCKLPSLEEEIRLFASQF